MDMEPPGRRRTERPRTRRKDAMGRYWKERCQMTGEGGEEPSITLSVTSDAGVTV